jgi:class 3 adenylate cyclase
VLSVLLLAASILIVAFPRHYVLIVMTILIINLISDMISHRAAGGYLSGLILIHWAILVPVLVVLLIGRRLVLPVIVLFVIAIIMTGFLDPHGNEASAQLEPAFVVQDSTANLIFLGLFVAGSSLFLFNNIERYRRRADDLLLNILPGPIAERLKQNPQTIADSYEDVTVLFADIVDFTTMSSGADAADVVDKLNQVFSDFDVLARKYGLEKIKTIGDAYMVAGGLPEPRADHCQAVAAFAQDMLKAMEKHSSWTDEPMRIRIGINRGPVVAGVIGQQKFIYDLWGDAVNVASRMESNGVANQIQVTEAVKVCLDGRYKFEEREPIYVKGKGMMTTYLLAGMETG